MDQTEKLRGRLYEPVGCAGIERAALLGTGRRLGDRYRVNPGVRPRRTRLSQSTQSGHDVTPRLPLRVAAFGQTQQRDSRTPAWLLSAAGGNTELA